MRTGMNKEAIEAMHELKKLSKGIENYQISEIYYNACDQIKSWDIAQAVVEIFAEDISEITLSNRLLEHFTDSGWSLEKIDNWFAEMPKGKNNIWTKERLVFNVQHEHGDELIKELSDDIKNNPEDIESAIAFLDALVYARRNNETWDLSWMAEIKKPKLITQAGSLASKLDDLAQYSTAKIFYEYALDMELTKDEVEQISMTYQAFVSQETVRASFKVQIREKMSKCLLNLDMKEKAQELMVEAADIRQKYNLNSNMLFAGQVQAESGQRVIEGRILEEEELSEDEPQYWYERAGYYRGRNESAQEEHALKKGLALTIPQPESERKFKGNRDWRSTFISDYAKFLKRQNRSKEAVELLLKEINEVPADSQSAIQAARLLAFEFEKLISINEEILWTWLENRAMWEYNEERLLKQMLENADRQTLDKHFNRAEKLAFDNNPTRACTLGWIENRMSFPKRSIALLKYAYENAGGEELKEKSAFNLLESYLDTDNWKNAEQIFPQASGRLTYREIPDWYSRIAISAAKSGAKEDAMRIWKNVANINPSMYEPVIRLNKYGLTQELKDFYVQMQQKMPSSEIPAKAIKLLEN